MSTLDLKQELHNYIDIANDEFVKALYENAKSHIEQMKMDRMIKEGEDDIKSENLHSSDEVKQYIENWKVS
ncbi:MAG: hypothetical protein KGV59_01640 [Tenacibaculum sp.]|nr:hypothetical protein [Tenacibaculum sp.]